MTATTTITCNMGYVQTSPNYTCNAGGSGQGAGSWSAINGDCSNRARLQTALHCTALYTYAVRSDSTAVQCTRKCTVQFHASTRALYALCARRDANLLHSAGPVACERCPNDADSRHHCERYAPFVSTRFDSSRDAHPLSLFRIESKYYR